MQKNTARKRFSLTIIWLALILFLIAIMYMIDRNFLKLQTMQRTLNEQSQDMRVLRTTLNQLKQDVEQGNIQTASRKSSTDPSTNTNSIRAFDQALQAQQKSDYAEGDWYVDAFGTNLSTLTPLVSSDAYSSTVQAYVMETLLTRDADSLEWRGLLAKSWQVSDDGLTITYQLRENVVFSDGEPFDAADVVFSFEFMMTEAIQAPRERSSLEKIDSVKQNNDYEVVFQLKEPYFKSLSLTGGMTLLAEHFYRPYLEQPQTFNESKGLLIGTGPYRLIDPRGWTPDKGGVELVRNSRYWGSIQPAFERMVWKIIKNDSARLTTYRNGDIDFYSARPIEYAKLLDDAAFVDKSQNLEYKSPTGGYSYLAWNQEIDGKASRFADKRVRQAMTYLTHRRRIIEEIYLGYGEVALSPFYGSSKQHAPDLKPRQYDLSKAKALLEAAGYSDKDGDGVLDDAAGKPFVFELTYFQDNEDTKRMVILLKDIYARAGIVLKPKPSEWPVMLDALEKKSFEAITLGWTGGLEGDIYQMFHSSQNKNNGDNFINYANPALDRMIEQARSTVDEDKRMPLWQEAERIIVEDQPYTFLVRRKSLRFIDKRIQNLRMTKMGLNDGLPMEWYVPHALQKYQQ